MMRRLKTIIMFALFLLISTGCQSDQVENDEDDQTNEEIIMEFSFVMTSPFDSTALHELLNAGPAVPVVFWECFDSWEELNEFAEVHGFAPPDEFDFNNQCMLITFGRKLVALKCEPQSYPVNSYKLLVTFEEENQENNLFIYGIERRDYWDALYFTGSHAYVADSEGNLSVYSHITDFTRLEYYLRGKEITVELVEGISGLVHASIYERRQGEIDQIREEWIGLPAWCETCHESFILQDGTRIKLIEFRDGWKILILEGDAHSCKEVWTSYVEMCAMLM